MFEILDILKTKKVRYVIAWKLLDAYRALEGIRGDGLENNDGGQYRSVDYTEV